VSNPRSAAVRHASDCLISGISLFRFGSMDLPVPPPMSPYQPRQNSGLALASMICGILGFCTLGLTGLPAIITGHMAIAAIKRSGESLGGRGMAIAGLITGYFSFIIIGLVAVAAVAGLAAPVVLKQRHAADRVEVINNLKQMHVALVGFEREYGSLPSDQLAAREAKFSGLTGSRVLGQLDARGIAPGTGRLLGMKSSYPGEWYYFPQAKLDPAGSGELLIGPSIGNKHPVLYIDGRASAISPAQYGATDLSAAVAIPAPPKVK